MRWYKEFDIDNDNPYYTASSIYHDDDCHFWWKITPILEGGKILWTVKDSQPELVCKEDEDLRWQTAGGAKKWVTRREVKCIIFEKQLQKTLADPLGTKPLIWDND